MAMSLQFQVFNRVSVQLRGLRLSCDAKLINKCDVRNCSLLIKFPHPVSFHAIVSLFFFFLSLFSLLFSSLFFLSSLHSILTMREIAPAEATHPTLRYDVDVSYGRLTTCSNNAIF